MMYLDDDENKSAFKTEFVAMKSFQPWQNKYDFECRIFSNLNWRQERPV